MQALPFVIVAGLAAFMVERDGGFAVTVWYPVGLAVLAVAVTLLWSLGRRRGRLAPLVGAAALLLTAFTGWGFLSIAWAAVRGDAWDGSNRTLLYLLVFGFLAAWPTTARALWPVLLALSLVVAVEGVATVEHIVRASNPSAFVIGSRLSEPMGYPNATAALSMIMVWLMVGLASRQWLPAPARGLAFGLAGLHLTLNLLAESRGSIFTLPLVALAYLLLVPGRLRSLAALALVAVGFAPVIVPVVRVYGTNSEHLGEAYRRAIDLGLVWAFILVVAGWLFGVADQRVRFSPGAVRRAGVGVVTAGIVAALVVAAVTRPWERLGPAWHSFKYAGEPSVAASHFGGLGSNRYDFWRVGLIEFERHPVQGIGVDNFLVPYLQQRRSSEQPEYPHSLAVDLLSETGIVGALLFAGFLALTVAAVLRIPPGREGELARIVLVGASVWMLHAQVDWLWEMPALGVLGMGLLGAAVGLGPRQERAWAPGGRRLALALGGAVSLAVAAAAASFAFPWAAQREIQHAAAVWRTNSDAALAMLDRAHALNPLSDQADLVAGAIASRLHRFGLARERFRSAVRRSPDDWYANLELGIAASLAGPRDLAASSLRRAAALDPREQIVRGVLRTFTAGRRIDPDAIDREFEAIS